MPKPKTERKKAQEVFVGDEIEIGTSVCVTLSAGYQSVKLEATIKGRCRKEDRKKAYKRAWAHCDNQIADRIGEARKTVKALGRIAGDMQRA